MRLRASRQFQFLLCSFAARVREVGETSSERAAPDVYFLNTLGELPSYANASLPDRCGSRRVGIPA